MENINCMGKMKSILCYLFALCFFFPACYRMRSSKGGGQIQTTSTRTINESDIAVPPGYKIEAVARGLTFPTAAAFDGDGNLYVLEAGYSYGEVWGEPKLLQIGTDGNPKLIAKGARNGPWTGMSWYNGSFFVAEGGEMDGGKILRISKDGSVTTLVDNLPSVGDHHTNGPVVKDGYIYFGQGTATNSAVVGTDNADFGWLLRRKDFHDIPCADVILNGQNYTSANPLTEDPNDKAVTGAYSPFGTSTTDGQIIKGSVPCNGSVMRIRIEGGSPELIAWGFRNPFGLAIANDGTVFVTDNAFDVRGSRPVWGTGDVLWRLQPNTWYGWPDFSEGKPISNDEEFKAPGKDKVKPLLKQLPNTPPKPAAVLGVHASANGFDFSRSNDFGYMDEAFVAEFGDMAPNVGKVEFPVGFKIVRVNTSTGVVRDFVVNKGKRNGPASWLRKGGLERPVAVKFDPTGKALYVVDFGILRMTAKGPEPQVNTGTIWRITKK